MEFTPIRITTIVPHKELNFNLYIHFKEKFLKYIDNGKELNEEQLLKLKTQNIDYEKDKNIISNFTFCN